MDTLRQISVPYRIVLAQLATGAVTGLIACVYGLEDGWAAWLGATIVVVPNAWLAWRLSDDKPSRESAASQKRKEEGPARILALSLTKFLTTAGAAALALAVVKPALAGFFAGLVVTVLTAALVPPFLAPQQLARAPRLD